jgi:hypothetical protein
MRCSDEAGSRSLRGTTFVTRFGALAIAALAPLVEARADEERERRLEEEIRDLRERIEALEAERLPPSPRAAEGLPGADGVELTPVWERRALETPAPLRGIYDKPFLLSAWRRAHVGGYFELDYHAFEDGVLGVPRGFRAHRFNLFAFTELSDRVHFGSELEFEHEVPGEDLEVKLEMAFVDWMLFEELVVRAGAILVPLGRINLNHDGPARELTDRPLVSSFVIPTTLTEVGVGPHGTFELGGGFSLDYEAYVTNGFRLLDEQGAMPVAFTERERLLREGRPSLGGDINTTPASTGRIALAHAGVAEVGGSWHVGTYDERNDNLLSIVAGDFAWVHRPFSFEGELAWAGFQRDAFAATAGIPSRFWGFYVQGACDFLPDALRRAVPALFGGDGATFTVVLRYDWIDLAGDRAEAIEPGINFRPIADTVFKFSYRFGLRSLGVRNIPGRLHFDDDGFIFSVASYF